MKPGAYLVFDIGTSAVKCALVGEGGNPLALERASIGLFAGDGIFAFESDPREWEDAAAACARRVLARTDGAEILAVAVSGNGPTLAFVDGNGAPIGRAVSWMDRSATAEAAKLADLGASHHDPSFYLPKVLRAVEREPDGRGAARRFVSCPEYLASVLGAEQVSYLPDPRYEGWIWDLRSATRLGLEPSRFPPYVEPATVIGRVSETASAGFGIRAGTPVISAFPDFLAAVIGSGATTPGVVCDRTGSSEAFNLCAPRAADDADLFSLPHPVRGLWNVSGGVSTSGKALEWLDGLFDESEASIDDLLDEAAHTAPGSGGLVFLPYLAGERAPLRAPELRGAFLGLGLEHERRHLSRAVAESAAFGLRLVAERVTADGLAPRLVRASGAQSASAFLCGLKADILGMPVETLALPDCELLGNAAACAVALGRQSNLAEASSALARVARRYEPDSRRAAVYDAAYGAFADALGALLPLVDRFARLRALSDPGRTAPAP